MQKTSNRLAGRSTVRGWTLVELLVAITIVLSLSGVLLVGGQMVNQSRRRATAMQQLQLIAAAIDQYAAFWPRWQAGSVVICDKGWPDFIAGRLFVPSPAGPFDTVAGFNDLLDLTGPTPWIDDLDMIKNANQCLVYALTATSGKGPFVLEGRGLILRDLHTLDPTGLRPLYPSIGGGAAKGRGMFLDPWGTPLRYFWVYRDEVLRTSHRGFLPVDYGAYYFGPTSDGGTGSDLFHQDSPTNAVTRKGVGYVLESAGPDKKFGNVWKAGPTAQEVAEAADNLTVTP